MQSPHRKKTRNRLIGAGAVLVLLVAMILSTKFLTPQELAEALPKPFEPAAVAKELYGRAESQVASKASPLGDVITAVQTDPKAAAEKYGAVAPNESTWVYAVRGTGVVTEATDQAIRLKIPGVPEETTVIVPLDTAIQGTVVRDGMGFKFADAPGQTDYQYVGDELKKLMQAAMQEQASGATKGKQVQVIGMIAVQNNGAPQPKAKPVNVQPIKIEVG
jgi:predicted lipoprotein